MWRKVGKFKSGGLVVWWPGGLVAWWPGGLVAWWSGGLVAWWDNLNKNVRV